MRIAASNIAWDPAEDESVAALLQAHAVDAVDIAPAKYFANPALATAAEIDAVRARWAGWNVEITGMQALLFGTTGLNVFGATEVRRALVEHLRAVCRIADRLGARRLVFGSPRNRDRSGLSDEDTLAIAIEFFFELGQIAGDHGVCICLEPNPPRYGANFMTNSPETARIVVAVAHPSIRMQLDTGALTINEEEPSQVLASFGHLVGHVHASEPDLLPLGDGSADHALIGRLLAERLPKSVVTIEMVATTNEPHLASVARALQVATRYYRSEQQRRPSDVAR